MTLPSLFLYLHCAVGSAAAFAAIFTTRGARTSISCFLLCMSSLAGIFVLLGAHVIAIAQLLFCAGLGFVYLFAADLFETARGSAGRTAREPGPGSGQWLVVMAGIAGASTLGVLLFELVSESFSQRLSAAPHSTPLVHSAPALQPFDAVAHAVLVDQAVALIGVGLVFLAALIGAGFLARRGLD